MKKNPDHAKYISTAESNKFSVEKFDVKLKQEKLATNTDPANTKQRSIEKKVEKLETYYLSLFIGKNYFSDGWSQNFVIFHQFSKLTQWKLVLQKQ